MNKFLVASAALIACATAASAQDYSLSASGWTNGPAGTTTFTGTQNLQAGPNAWAISPYTGSTMVGLTPTNPTATFNTMTGALGMSSASASALAAEIAAQNPSGGGTITNGAWISKDFTFNAPATFSMYWVYTSTDYVPFNDGSITSFVNVNSATTLAKINNVATQYLLLGATNPGTGNYSTGSYGSTGWQIVNYEVVDAGTYKLGFASFNQGDTALSPVLYVNDGLGTVTKNGQTFGAVAPNDPNMPTVPTTPVTPPTPPAPTVVSTTPTNPDVASSTTYGTATTANLVTVGSTNTGSAFNVTKTTTPVTATPYTITTTTTPKVIQSWSDNTTTTIVDPNNPAYTTTQTGTAYQTGTSSSSTKSVSSAGAKDAVAYKNMNLFLIDPLSTPDGSWAAPAGSINGKFALSGAAFGWQRTIDNNTFGFAFSHLAGDSRGYTGSKTSTESTSGTAYIMSRQPYAWVKGSVGFSSSDHRTNVSIPEFALINNNKVNQKNFYADMAVYSPQSFYGFRPLVGVTVNRSELDSTESGSPLLSSKPRNGSTAKASPYIGARYEISKNAAIETRVITNTDQKTIISNRVTVSEKIGNNVAVTATIGFDKGINTKYNNTYGLVGLKWVF
jgi:hypothetical protein